MNENTEDFISQKWYRGEKLHRLDGPAIIRSRGSNEWYVDGIRYDEIAFNAKIVQIKVNNFIIIRTIRRMVELLAIYAKEKRNKNENILL